MTAEVVILNRDAVAIAADSAVTLGAPGSKIYNTANKLFQLSNVEPVAAMVYGAGSFNSIPWETVIKEHRRQLRSTPFPTVEEYAAALIGYIPALVRRLSREEQLEHVIMTALWELDMVRDSLERLASAGGSHTDAQVREAILGSINYRIDQLQQPDPIRDISAALVGREINVAIKDWSAFVDERLNGFPTNAVIKRRARVMVRASLRARRESPWSTGLVVAGFGTAQLFPALSHYVVDGAVGGRVRAWKVDDVRIGKDQSASIYPFAQGDMVVTFMDGIHPDYRRALRNLENSSKNT